MYHVTSAGLALRGLSATLYLAGSSLQAGIDQVKQWLWLECAWCNAEWLWLECAWCNAGKHLEPLKRAGLPAMQGFGAADVVSVALPAGILAIKLHVMEACSTACSSASGCAAGGLLAQQEQGLVQLLRRVRSLVGAALECGGASDEASGIGLVELQWMSASLTNTGVDEVN
jgi:hypothetical protein